MVYNAIIGITIRQNGEKMAKRVKRKKEKKPNPLYTQMVKLFASRTARNILTLVVMLIAVFCMFMLDQENYVLKKFMPILDSNFIKDFMVHFNIQSFNVSFSAWLIFLCVMGVILTFIFFGIFAPKIVKAIARAKRDSFKTELGARRFYATIYYLVVLVICAAIIFMFYMGGAFDDFNEYTAGLFMNLLYTVLLSLMFSFIAVLSLVIVYYVLKFILSQYNNVWDIF